MKKAIILLCLLIAALLLTWYFTSYRNPPEYRPILTSTATLDFPNTAAGAASDLTITVNGAVDGNPVIIGAPNGSVSATDNVVYFGWISAANTVTVRFANCNLITAVNPASGTFRASVITY